MVWVKNGLIISVYIKLQIYLKSNSPYRQSHLTTIFLLWGDSANHIHSFTDLMSVLGHTLTPVWPLFQYIVTPVQFYYLLLWNSPMTVHRPSGFPQRPASTRLSGFPSICCRNTDNSHDSDKIPVELCHQCPQRNVQFHRFLKQPFPIFDPCWWIQLSRFDLIQSRFIYIAPGHNDNCFKASKCKVTILQTWIM